MPLSQIKVPVGEATHVLMIKEMLWMGYRQSFPDDSKYFQYLREAKHPELGLKLALSRA